MTFFCKICFDAKNDGYDTHNIRDRETGRLTCKYLAGLECDYCGENGHTPSHCLKKKKDLSRSGSKKGIIERAKHDEVVSMGKIGKDIGKREDIKKPIKTLEMIYCLEIEGKEERDTEIVNEISDIGSDLDGLPPVSEIKWGTISTYRWGD